jgi:peptide/nickel transport system substrate-binding protein
MLALTACTWSSSQGSASPSHRRSALPAGGSQYRPEPAQHEGGTVTVGHWESPSDLSPLHNDEPPALLIERALFAGLVTLDDQLGALPDLVTVVPTPANGGVRADPAGPMEVTYRLRPGLKWSDGEPLTAADVEFTWQRIVDAADLDVRVPRDGYRLIERVVVVDATTAQVVFKGLYPPYLTLFPFVLPKHRLARIPAANLHGDRYWRQPDVVSGPYLVTRVQADELITLARNRAWEQGRDGQRAHLDGIKFRIFSEKNGLIAAARNGQIDVALGLGERDLTRASGNFEVRTKSTLEYEQLTFNQLDPNPTTNQAPLWKGDPALLEALNLAINRPGLQNLLGKGRLTPSPLLSGLPYPHAGDVTPPRYDIPQANRLLDEDGWSRGTDGTRVKGGRRLAFTLTTIQNDPLRSEVANMLVAGWSEVGAQVPIRELRPQVLFPPWPRGILARGSYEVGLWTWLVGADPDFIFAMEHSTEVPNKANPGGGNFGRFANADIDRYLEAGRARLDPLARAQAYQGFERAYVNYRGELPLFERLSVTLAAHRLHNLLPNPSPSTTFWNLADWWIGR